MRNMRVLEAMSLAAVFVLVVLLGAAPQVQSDY